MEFSLFMDLMFGTHFPHCFERSTAQL